MGMADTWNTLRAKDARHRVAFRTFSPILQAVLAPTCALTGGESYAGRVIYVQLYPRSVQLRLLEGPFRGCRKNKYPYMRTVILGH
jgi:hypothetical protein